MWFMTYPQSRQALLNGNSAVLLFGLIISGILGCAPSKRYVENREDLCEIFSSNPSWYESAQKAQSKWNVPIPLMMAIIAQESGFDATARPPRQGGFLWVFPGTRPSSAYGFSQALDGTWDLYRESTGKRWAKRNNFNDSVDFVGWYCHQSHIKCGISKKDAYSLYLAYHEGHGGFNAGTYKGKAWLLKVARSVEARSKTYAAQLQGCPAASRASSRSCLWPF